MLEQMYYTSLPEVKNQYLSKSNNSSFLLPLCKYLEQFDSVPIDFLLDHEKDCRVINIKKNKYILSPMDSNDSLFFLVKGLVRGFIKDENKDISTWFAFENEVLSVMRHPYVESNYSSEYIQAIEDCQLIVIPFTLIDYLYDHYPNACTIGRKIISIHHHLATERSILARIPSAIARFKRFQNSKIDINRIPQRFLASYLGMRIETLSRIRSKALYSGLKIQQN